MTPTTPNETEIACPACPRCGGKSVCWQDYQGLWSARCRNGSKCGIKTPSKFTTKQAALEWWTQPFTRPPTDSRPGDLAIQLAYEAGAEEGKRGDERTAGERTAELQFGDYCLIEQVRFGAENEMYEHKVISRFRSNVWVEVPVQTPAREVTHSHREEVVACVTVGIDETKVRTYRLQDCQLITRPAELVAVFKRNIRMHESSPLLINGIGTPEQKVEIENFIKGLKRGLEIVEYDYTKAALASGERAEGMEKC